MLVGVNVLVKVGVGGVMFHGVEVRVAVGVGEMEGGFVARFGVSDGRQVLVGQGVLVGVAVGVGSGTTFTSIHLLHLMLYAQSSS